MINLKTQKLTDALVKLEAACDTMPQIAEKVRGEALGHAILGAGANIYNTTPGAYQRTQDYLRGLDTRARSSRNRATVTVLNTTDYAPYVEFGRQVGGAALLQAQALAQMQGDPAAPFAVGRSGAQWWLAGPVVTGAQVFAVYRMRELFAKAVREAL